jgi:hypothetical protein
MAQRPLNHVESTRLMGRRKNSSEAHLPFLCPCRRTRWRSGDAGGPTKAERFGDGSTWHSCRPAWRGTWPSGQGGRANRTPGSGEGRSVKEWLYICWNWAGLFHETTRRVCCEAAESLSDAPSPFFLA